TGGRSDRFTAGVAFLDGKTPSPIMVKHIIKYINSNVFHYNLMLVLENWFIFILYTPQIKIILLTEPNFCIEKN
ncbi:hypothetical protein POY92_08085, partial [Phocaeicola vulgatus]|nr:hypothetical protein [Phocaeicola vulgatus]